MPVATSATSAAPVVAQHRVAPAPARPHGPLRGARAQREGAAPHARWAGRRRRGALAGALPAARLLRHLRELDALDRRRASCRSCATCSSSCPRAATSASTRTGATGRAGRTSTCASCRGSSSRYGAGTATGDRRALDGRARRDGLRGAAAADVPRGGVLLRRPAPARRPALLARAVLAATRSDPRAVWGDPETDRDVWRRHDPTALLPALKGIPLFVSAGDGRPARSRRARRDRGGRGGGGVARVRAPRPGAARPASTPTSTAPGIHDWPYWQRELHRALPLLLLGAIRQTTSRARASHLSGDHVSEPGGWPQPGPLPVQPGPLPVPRRSTLETAR